MARKKRAKKKEVVQKPFDVELTDEQKNKLITQIRLDVGNAYSDRSELDAKDMEYQEIYYQQMPDIDFPHENASNAHIPYPAMVVDTVKSRAKTGVMKRPIYKCEVKDVEKENHEDISNKIEDFFDYTYAVEMDLDMEFDELFINTGVDPCGWLMPYLKDETTETREDVTYSSVEEFEKDFDNAKKDYPDQYSKLKNGQKVTETVTDYEEGNSAAADVLAWEDVIFPPKTRFKDIFTKVPFIAHRTTLTYNELKSREAANVYQDVDKIYTDTSTSGDATKKDCEVWRIIWYNNIDETDVKKWEIYLAGDLENIETAYSDINSDTSDEANKGYVILRLKRYPYWHQRNNYIPFRYISRPGRVYGQSLVEKAYQISKIQDTIFRQQIDCNTWENAPIIAHGKAAGFDPAYHEIAPLADWDLKDISQIKEFRFGGSNMMNPQILAMLSQMNEALLGVSSLNSGQAIQGDPNAPARKTELLLNQQGLRVGDYIANIRVSLQELAYQVGEIYYQYADEDSLKYRNKKGEWASFKEIKEYLHGRVMYVPQGDEITADPKAEFERNMVLVNVIAERFPELKSMYPVGWFNLLRDVLQSSKKKDYNKITPEMDVIREWAIEIQMEADRRLQAQQAEQQMMQAQRDEAMKNQGAMEHAIGVEAKKGEAAAGVVADAAAEVIEQSLRGKE